MPREAEASARRRVVRGARYREGPYGMKVQSRSPSSVASLSGHARSYRDRFRELPDALSYDQHEYSPYSYPALLSRIEQGFLSAIVGELSATLKEVHYLDFACGTGRVISFLQPRVDTATGVDVSPSMLSLARQKVPDATIVQADITSDPQALAGPFDLITAFRFVLNAEPDLRYAAFSRLSELLRDERSVLIFNNHINLWSYKLATWPAQRVARFAGQPSGMGNFLTSKQVHELCSACGLMIERVYGCGFLSRRAMSLVGYDRLYGVESRLARIMWLRHFGADQVYVARRVP